MFEIAAGFFSSHRPAMNGVADRAKRTRDDHRPHGADFEAEKKASTCSLANTAMRSR